ncbi:MAG: BRO family protein [Victivallaceae bacterium]|nr:BRO family protein [Victivallaceae bacterium]
MFNQMFKFHRNEVRLIMENNQPWFAAKDVCEVLEIVDYLQAVNALDDDERGRYNIPTPGGQQEMVAVNESGLYHLIFKSRKKVAREFRKWVTSDVLPSIRKYGFFMSTRPKDSEKRQFIERFFPRQVFGSTSQATGYKKLVPVFPHFRSCKIAKANKEYHPDLFSINNQQKQTPDVTAEE